MPRGKHTKDDLREERYSASCVFTNEHSVLVVILSCCSAVSESVVGDQLMVILEIKATLNIC